jgi:predicted PhzF superfamily epimerase YddE/YHI9
VALLLRDAAAVLAAEPDREALLHLSVGLVGPHAHGDPADVEVRALTGLLPALEDPVTGSLNAGIAQWLIGSGRLPERYTAAQGQRLGRSGRVFLEREDETIWVGGDTVVGVVGEVAL